MILCRCGIGKCQPKLLEKCANIKFYTANFFLLSLVYLAYWSYLSGVMRTIEKRFALSAVKSGTILTLADSITTALVLFMGYVGSNMNKPRGLGLLTSLVGFAAVFAMAGQHIYFPPRTTQNGLLSVEHRGNNSHPSEEIANDLEKDLCHTNGRAVDVCDSETSSTFDKSQSDISYMIMLIGAILVGIGGSPFICFGYSYVDENVSKTDSPLYIGKLL